MLCDILRKSRVKENDAYMSFKCHIEIKTDNVNLSKKNYEFNR